jgi:hypothetical protein
MKNYSIIDVAFGGHLGGARNPMTRREYAEHNSRLARPEHPHTPTPNNHLGNIAHFQQDKGVKAHVTNEAGANVHVASGQLGFTSGGYGVG